VSSQSAGSGSTASTAVALTPPAVATASPESATARTSRPRVPGPLVNATKGSNTHGATALGSLLIVATGARVLMERDIRNLDASLRELSCEPQGRAR